MLCAIMGYEFSHAHIYTHYDGVLHSELRNHLITKLSLFLCTCSGFLLFVICTNKYTHTHTHTYIYIYIIILQTLLHVSVPLHHLQGALILCLLKLYNIKIIKIT